MTLNCQLALYFLQFLASTGALQEPQQEYAHSSEEAEASELIQFVGRSSARGITPPPERAEVRITSGMRIFIGTKELVLRPMSKAILLLFLLHPEGIELKRIADYEDELTRYYSKVSRSDNPDAMRQRVARVTDTFTNELNVNLSRVNAAISALESDGEYQVGGKRREPKGIPLDRSLVIWE